MRAQPAPVASANKWVSAAMQSVLKTQAARDAGKRVAPAVIVLPQIDTKSPNLTRYDRLALAEAMRASQSGDMSNLREGATSTYIADRIAIAQAYNAGGKSAAGRDAKGLRCAMVAAALDRSAGRYVVGGEKAASAARAAVAGEVKACATLKAQADAKAMEGHCTSASLPAKGPAAGADRARLISPSKGPAKAEVPIASLARKSGRDI
jgi:hypothetical protein